MPVVVSDPLTGSGNLSGSALGASNAPTTNWAGSTDLKRGGSGLYNNLFNTPSMCSFTTTVPAPPGGFALQMSVANIGGSPQDYIQAKLVLSTGWEYQIDIDPFGFGADGTLLFEMDLTSGAYTKKRNGSSIGSGTTSPPDFAGVTEVGVTLQLRIQNLVNTSLTTDLTLTLDVEAESTPTLFWTEFSGAYEVL